jgi:hypothetical protein
MLYHATVAIETGEESFMRGGTIELWIDAHHNLAREERTSDLVVQEKAVTFDTVRIVMTDAEYTLYRSPESRLDTGKADACYGAPEAVATLLGCPGALEESTTTVAWGGVDGQPAVVLVTTGTSRGEDETVDFTERLYLDAETLLPLVLEMEGLHTWGPFRTREVYQHEFIAQDAVPADLFDSASLVVARLADARPTVPSYWLGAHFDPPGDLPPLVIQDGGVPDDPAAGDVLYLSYRSTDVRFHLSGALVTEVVMQEWPRAAWEADVADNLRAYWEDDECGEQIEIALPNGRATIFLGYLDTLPPGSSLFGAPTPPSGDTSYCPPDRPYKRFEAVAYLGETVVYLAAPPESRYRSREGLEAILRALQPFDLRELATMPAPISAGAKRARALTAASVITLSYGSCVPTRCTI